MLYLKEVFDLWPVLLPFSVISAPPNGFPFTNVDTLTTTSFGLLGTVFGIRVGVGGLLSPLGTPSSTGNPSESLVNTPPPLSPANLLPIDFFCQKK